MNTVDSYVKTMMTNSRIENSLKKKSGDNGFNMTTNKKSTSTFQSVKYLTQIAGAKSQQQVYAVIRSLKRELSQAKNCENYDAVVRSIRKVQGKAEQKIVKLVSEKATEKKRKKAELERKIEERKKQDKILRIKKLSRKECENFDIYEGVRDDADLLKSEYDNMFNNNMSSESQVGSNLDEVTSWEGDSDTDSSTVDTVI